MSTVVEQIGELLTRLQSPDFYEREEAVKELGARRDEESIAGLVLALEDADPGIRELAAEQLTGIGGPTASQLLIRFLASEDIGTRNLASEVLFKIGADAVPLLIDNLQNDDDDVRRFIVDVLGLIADSRALDSVCRCLWDDNANVAYSAAEALGGIGSEGAVPHLVAVIDEGREVRLPAVEALGKIGDMSALSRLHELLTVPDPILRYAAIEAAGQIGSEDSLPCLMPCLDDPDRTIAESALVAAMAICNARGGLPDTTLPLDPFIEFIFEGIRNNDAGITEFVLSRLPQWQSPEVIDRLLGTLDAVNEEGFQRVVEVLIEMRQSVGGAIVQRLQKAPQSLKLRLLDTLRHLADEGIAETLSGHAEDGDPEVRQRVAHILGISSWQGAIPVLRRLADDQNGHVRAAAYSALGWLASDSDTDFILGGLEDRYLDVREAAVGALIIIGGPRVIAKFTADLYHEKPERQQLAVTALGWLGETDVVEALLSALNHPDAGVRKSAISSLSRIGSIGDLNPIRLALTDENSSVRKAAVSALIALMGAEAIHDIRQSLEDSDVWVRYHTITCIGDLGRQELSEYLLPYLDDPLDIVKLAAAKALSLLGDTRAVPALTRLKSERNKDLVTAAEAALTSIGGRKNGKSIDSGS